MLKSNEPTPVAVALGGLCPRCGAKTLFAGFARFAPECRACGLDFSAFNVGDGPAAFMTLGIGGLVTALAISLELSAAPPWCLHVLLWLPLASLLVLVSLRFSKAALLALEYRHRAREGRIGDKR
ncbi:MAG TPA: DUF983 domain-containing protein [Allosphingosinicella sp.]|nr:DUF983 domain-containing protein [Allosphingosinicella sp.]